MANLGTKRISKLDLPKETSAYTWSLEGFDTPQELADNLNLTRYGYTGDDLLIVTEDGQYYNDIIKKCLVIASSVSMSPEFEDCAFDKVIVEDYNGVDLVFAGFYKTPIVENKFVASKRIINFYSGAFQFQNNGFILDLTDYGQTYTFPTAGEDLFGEYGFPNMENPVIKVPYGRKAELAAMTNWSTWADYMVEVIDNAEQVNDILAGMDSGGGTYVLELTGEDGVLTDEQYNAVIANPLNAVVLLDGDYILAPIIPPNAPSTALCSFALVVTEADSIITLGVSIRPDKSYFIIREVMSQKATTDELNLTRYGYTGDDLLILTSESADEETMYNETTKCFVFDSSVNGIYCDECYAIEKIIIEDYNGVDLTLDQLYMTYVESLILPKRVKDIGGRAFAVMGANPFTLDLTAYGQEHTFPTIGEEAFGDYNIAVSKKLVIKVPYGRKAELAAMTNWSTWADYMVEVVDNSEQVQDIAYDIVNTVMGVIENGSY